MTLEQYIDNINKRYKLGNATEHTFRGDLQQLLESLVPDIRATNEPKRQSCGAPDYILTKKEIPVGFIEAKDIGDKDLEGAKKTGNKEQFDRYKASLNNLIFTDYLDFHLYIDGIFITKIAIAEIQNGTIVPLPNNFATFTNLIKDFSSHVGQTIKSSKKLAEMMAGKARLLSDVIEKALTSDEANKEDSTLKDQMNAFKQILIHDITPKGFADVYAQTISYGMFAARLHDPTLPTFSRQEAAELIPKSNPFLRKLFGYIAGPDIDDRIKWIVDSLVDIFLACNVEEILKNYGKSTKMEDPIIHFYETFLSEYDPKLRKARGVWYTPAPVVNFIVRAVDDILKTEFDLPQGLADSSKINHPSPSKGGELVHKVQILDPATGTGTFLAETIKHIHKKFEGQQGIWSNYVETHLLPRLNGFELLMASYAMAHLKLDLLLTETGYKPTTNQRFRVYLTNSLEEHHQDTGTLFANWLSAEANEANHIKRDTPVMCVIGNPPYSGISSNNGEWISKLIEDYKYVDGVHFNERKHWLNDDYVKFLRYGQHFIEKNGSGVLAFINPHGFLDNPTFRGMRWHLLKTYDKIYTIDLHGNSKKKETAPDGSADVNVFDIMQGVSINIFIKTGKKKTNELGKVFHFDLYGKREMKYDFLSEMNLKDIDFSELNYNKPYYFFVPKNDDGRNDFENGFRVNEIFNDFTSGMVTANDALTIFNTKEELANQTERILSSVNPFTEFGIKDSRRIPKEGRIEDLKTAKAKGVMKINFRPFDVKFMYKFEKNEHWINSPRTDIMQHFINAENVGLVVSRQCADDWKYILCTKDANDFNLTGTAGRYGSGYTFPLYLYPETNGQQTIGQSTERTPNLNAEIVKQIADKLGLTFVPEKFPSYGGVAESRGGESTGFVAESLGRRNTKNYMDLPYNPNLKERAKELRQAGNLSEVLFWNQVKNKQFKGFDFDRQKIVGNYIVDFYCSNCNVVIEIDGSSHDDKQEYDAARDSFLESLGLTVIHIPVVDVMKKMNGVMKMLFNHPALEGTPPSEGNFAPIDILDYIYAVLHSPSYREKYKEFLKIDFPRVPYPKDKDTFWQLVKLGGEIRQIHLLESPPVEKYITQYPEDGNNVVVKPKYENGKVYINDTQYFDNVPQVAWDFYIGGYQPAQKWLKDRKERTLEFDDILHYQKIIVALTETDRLMKEIDKLNIE
jgi:very-short-patch-repair endonuclease